MIEENVLLKSYTNYQIGGPARFFLTPKNFHELKDGLTQWQQTKKNLPIEAQRVFILGSGTNVLVSDNGFNGLVIHLEIDFLELSGDFELKVGASTTIKKMNEFCIENELSGFEWSGGLPGSVGGAIFGNAGAFGGETKDNVYEVESLDIETLEVKKRNNEACGFGYRNSIFKESLARKEIITSVTFKMKPGKKAEIREAIEDKITYRQNHQPLDYPSAGSTFKNVPLDGVPSETKEKFKEKVKNDPFPIIPAAVLLADANLKGFSVGNAQVSEKHPNFLVNKGGATSGDIEALINKIIEIIKEKYGIVLEPEVIRVK